MSFTPPSWASQPERVATLEVYSESRQLKETRPIDTKPYYLLGRAADQVDIVLDDSSCSRAHAALVHHSDGRLFLIDLQSTHGTTIDGRPISGNKPAVLKDGACVKFGQLTQRFIIKCESSAEKRRCDQLSDMKVRASHLLVKHKDSRRPSSWKEPTITRTEDEALQMINAFRQQLALAFRLQIVSGEVDFATLASRESHCSSAQRGGDLGDFGPGQMQKAFEDAAFGLQVGELSGPVFSDSGVHLVLRTA
eukprot:gene14640-20676_t